ncbi:MAG TPA: hypothetical protein VGS22_05355 [Thermoanaerobaculia bacterium]|jgi:hypothetical protein|nr:hypothetical protein [Thermoanaerobaculia bacterium]
MELNQRSPSRRFKTLAIIAITAMTAITALALPAAAQATKVIAIQVYADPAGSAGAVRYGVAPENEAVPVTPGERLRLTLVGTALVNSKGQEIEMPATFSIAAGDSVTIVGRGSNWVDVAIDGDANGVAGQIGYRVGDDYEMRGALTNGRITLQTQGRPGGSGGGSHGGGSHDGGNSSRHEKATTVTRALIEGILNRTFETDRDDEWVDEVYEGGYDSVLSVAEDLARQASRRGSQDAEATVRRLYRFLLRRSSDKIDSDDGFWTNVTAMRKTGLSAVVETIVGSDEFSRAFHLDDFDAR